MWSGRTSFAREPLPIAELRAVGCDQARRQPAVTELRRSLVVTTVGAEGKPERLGAVILELTVVASTSAVAMTTTPPGPPPRHAAGGLPVDLARAFGWPAAEAVYRLDAVARVDKALSVNGRFMSPARELPT
jgi:hypothetical protein